MNTFSCYSVRMRLSTLFTDRHFLRNLFGHSFAQLALTAVPLLILPYLTRVLGLERFGEFVYILAIAHLIDAIVAYGFRLSATADIADRESLREVSQLFWTVFFARVLIFFVVGLLLFLSIGLFLGVAQLIVPGVMVALLVTGNIFAGAWFFNGMQSANLYAIAVAVGRLVYVCTVLIAVNGPDDLSIAFLAYGTGYFVSGGIGYYLARKFYGIPFQLPNARMLYEQLVSGWDVFVAQMLVTSYTSANIVFLGWFAVPAAIANYAIGEKVYRFVASLATPFQRALFPVLNNRERSDDRAADLPVKSVRYQFYLFVVCSMMIAYFAEDALRLLTGVTPEEDAIFLFRILVFGSPFFVTTAITTYHLTTYGKTKQLRVAVVAASVLNIISIIPVLEFYGALGLAFLVVFIQIFLSSTQVSILVSAVRIADLMELRRGN